MNLQTRLAVRFVLAFCSRVTFCLSSAVPLRGLSRFSQGWLFMMLFFTANPRSTGRRARGGSGSPRERPEQGAQVRLRDALLRGGCITGPVWQRRPDDQRGALSGAAKRSSARALSSKPASRLVARLPACELSLFSPSQVSGPRPGVPVSF
jgi:hypothetical protein